MKNVRTNCDMLSHDILPLTEPFVPVPHLQHLLLLLTDPCNLFLSFSEVPKPDTMSYEDYLVNYVLDAYKARSKHGRPVLNFNDTLTVKFAIQLLQIVDLDEQDQVLTLNIWDQYVSAL